MLGVLIVILGRDVVAGRGRIARKLKIFLGDRMRRAADLHFLAVRLVHPGERIVMMTAAATATAATTVVGLAVTVTTPHALVLTVSHDWPVADSQFAIPSIPANSCCTLSLAALSACRA
jgi:hypothetical protein